jgi:putative lipase involved disintegration of autophagic bodies
MERIYDRLEHVLQLWKKLEITKPDTTDHNAIIKQIRIPSDKYKELI